MVGRKVSPSVVPTQERVEDRGPLLSIDPGEMNTRMHADAIPEADPTTLADPAEIAARIVWTLVHADELPNGARLSATTMRSDDTGAAA